MKKKLTALTTGLVLLGMSGMAQAELTTIGTATYSGGEYNLIWDDDNNGQSVIWLDVVNDPASWKDQNAWATGLESQLVYNIDSAYAVTWTDTAWRLGSTVDGPYVPGYDGSTTGGYNITSSEMGHLFYVELGNPGEYDTSGDPQSPCGLINTGEFNSLIENWYWSGTENSNLYAWAFNMENGNQANPRKDNLGLGLALRGADVSAVPVPGALWLLGSGLTGLVVLGRRRKEVNCD